MSDWVVEQTGLVYNREERARRDATPWTLVQGLLAPIQFVVFLVSLVLVLRTLITSEGAEWAGWSVVIKTLTLYAIMVTGAIWEKVVFGQYLFARPFFWEDMVSMLVIGLHTAAVVAWFLGEQWLSLEEQLWLALAAYAAYVSNAAQFLYKLRLARREQSMHMGTEVMG